MGTKMDATLLSGRTATRLPPILCLLYAIIIGRVFGCDRCIQNSKVAYYSTSEATKVGACGYGALGATLNRGDVAAISSKLYRKGMGCGACYQIRCTDPELCSRRGAKLVATDLTEDNHTDFVISRRTFSSLALGQKGDDLLNLGIVDIQYKRIICDQYAGQNMSVKVDESSSYPYYLAVQFLYQGGQTDIVAVDVAQVGRYGEWRYMRRNHGAVWDTEKPPRGALSFRFVVTAGYDGKWVWAKYVLPPQWKAGNIYESGVQIDDIAQEGCSPCDTQQWTSGV